MSNLESSPAKRRRRTSLERAADGCLDIRACFLQPSSSRPTTSAAGADSVSWQQQSALVVCKVTLSRRRLPGGPCLQIHRLYWSTLISLCCLCSLGCLRMLRWTVWASCGRPWSRRSTTHSAGGRARKRRLLCGHFAQCVFSCMLLRLGVSPDVDVLSFSACRLGIWARGGWLRLKAVPSKASRLQ